jgi:hypothetical protein
MKRQVGNRAKIIIFIFAAVLSAGAAVAENAVIIRMAVPECPWSDVRLDEKLKLRLSTLNRAPIVFPGEKYRPHDSAMQVSGIDDLVAIGREAGGRYLVDIFVDRMDIEKRKTTVIPQVVTFYRVYGVITGTIRITDVTAARNVKLQNFQYELKASARWQFVDDDENDADLKTAADEKMELFDRLEAEAAEGLFAEIEKLVRSS